MGAGTLTAIPERIGSLPKDSAQQLDAQGLRVFRLMFQFASGNQQTPNAPVRAVGRTLIYDPTGSELATGLEIAFEKLDDSQYVQIYPGITYDFRTLQFEKLFLRAQCWYFSTATAASGAFFVGRLIVSNSLVANLVGSSPANAIYTRPAPDYVLLGTIRQGDAAFGVNPGGSGIFTYRGILPIPVGGPGIRVWIKNLGATTLYIANQAAVLTNPATESGSAFPVAPGEEKSLTAGTNPNNFFNVLAAGSSMLSLSVYSADPAAVFAYHLEVLQ